MIILEDVLCAAVELYYSTLRGVSDFLVYPHQYTQRGEQNNKNKSIMQKLGGYTTIPSIKF